ncbi:nucleoside triphosphate pyrophosphohydrolase [Marinobacterium sediminicola]|uniref:ATP diphosphatase n=1 Tax=Marinobacterium sediminicola TaxID=518898 RepID=A0ABY1RZJ7_9GAMM|nr:nucleoside triphosphate pyrophosphohydrolase [Marinobacterium sediminicola]ULG69925.1 nucleoside triphosphate pyrophosphohydrolase [Marinobacterium sediminicola]SMR74374.1 ATP diphosphatase [Marinobacterium sediminicola]
MSYTLDDLIRLMDALRNPDSGCPWDLEQTFASIVPHTLEEAYEVADCIERQDWEHLRDELGDLLFQVVFYARMADENQWFDLHAVIDQLVGKLIRRHPHVFPKGTLDSAGADPIETDQVSQKWEAIKQQERNAKSRSGVLDEVPLGLPALSRAAKLQRRAARVGFDWPEIGGVLDKIEEEIGELRQALEQGDLENAREEIGDLLFAQVNLARHLEMDPEQALRNTNSKFERRFGYVEQQVNEGNHEWQQLPLEQLDQWWDEAKVKGL